MPVCSGRHPHVGTHETCEAAYVAGCDVDEGNVCGIARLPNGNNCGAQGQACFRCGSFQSCEHGSKSDYCVKACTVEVSPASTTSGPIRDRDLHNPAVKTAWKAAFSGFGTVSLCW